ncbi:MAG: DUF6448 family protein [bacterium]
MKLTKGLILTITLMSLAGAHPGRVFAHCDTLDGPVVQDARKALERKDVTPVLKWIPQEDESAVREAFDKTLAVRGLSNEARGLADLYFFETLVRIHRQSEGAPYTGLKPAGSVDPLIAEADRSLESGSVEKLETLVLEAVKQGIHETFHEAVQAKKNVDTSVAAGREFVKAYVTFVHYVERIYQAAHNRTAHEGHEPAPAPASAEHQGH